MCTLQVRIVQENHRHSLKQHKRRLAQLESLVIVTHLYAHHDPIAHLQACARWLSFIIDATGAAHPCADTPRALFRPFGSLGTEKGSDATAGLAIVFVVVHVVIVVVVVAAKHCRFPRTSFASRFRDTAAR
jgi:hypothetical protein